MANRGDLLKLMPLALLGAEAGYLSNGLAAAKNASLDRQPFGTIRTFYNGSTPGRNPHPPRQHPDEEIMVVTEGAGEISVVNRA